MRPALTPNAHGLARDKDGGGDYVFETQGTRDAHGEGKLLGQAAGHALVVAMGELGELA